MLDGIEDWSLECLPEPLQSQTLPLTAFEPIRSQDGIVHFNPVIIICMFLIKPEDSAKAVRSVKEEVAEFIESMVISNGQSFSVFAISISKPLTTLSSWLMVFAQFIGHFMDLPALISEKTLQAFVDSPKYALHGAANPRDVMRPIVGRDDERAIVYPADCTYDSSLPNQSNVDTRDAGIVEIKGLPRTLGSCRCT
ncbi:hypothetical protein LX36DRAFT_747916 [Colletotrichum falcatum]|nr:hypothetical protein LX36DRAFT_747916 [Colletotrichum falcatum]